MMVGITPELLARHDRPGPRYTSYPTALDFTADYGPEDHRERLEAAGERRDHPLSVYLHLPFCSARCSFCACHVVVTRSETLPEVYARALYAEMATIGGLLAGRRRVVQYHWGGGTPTFYPPEMLHSLHRRFLDWFDVAGDAEISAEVDPRVTTSEHLEALARLGFNRLSAGVQDVDERVQALIGRGQTHQQTTALVEGARRLGFTGINLDLVYGLPGQTEESFHRTLDAVVALRPDRLAVYSFAYLPQARPHQRRIPRHLLPDRALKLTLLAAVVERLTGAGYRHIGLDHFALPGDELSVAASNGTLTRNFMGHTTKRGTDLVAFGTSGISELDGVYAQDHRRLADYLATASRGQLPVERGLVPTRDDRIRRQVITDLMCNGRVDLGPVGEDFHLDPAAYFRAELGELALLREEGLVTVDSVTVTATDLGRLLVRRLAMVFDAHLDRDRAVYSSAI